MDPMPSTSPVRRPAKERRAEVFATARLLVLEKGLSEVTLRAIAERMAVAPSLVAHYVPSMQELEAELFGAIVQEELEALAAELADIRSAIGKLDAILTRLLSQTREEIALLWVQSWALSDRNEHLAARVRLEMDAWESFLQKVLRGGIDAREFADVDSRAVARQLLGMIDGLNAHSLVHWSDFGERRSLMATAVEAILHLPRGSLQEPSIPIAALQDGSAWAPGTKHGSTGR